jgi:hypothetical protein
MFAQSGFADLPFTGAIPPVIYSLTGDAGAYSYTGVAASFVLSKKLIASAEAYSYTGTAATLTYVSGQAGIDYTLLGGAGAYLYTGGNATFEYVLRGWHPVNTAQTSSWGLILKHAIWTNLSGDAVGWMNDNGDLVYWGTDTQIPNWTAIDNNQQAASVSWVNTNNEQVEWTNIYGNVTLWGNPFSWQTINTFQ